MSNRPQHESVFRTAAMLAKLADAAYETEERFPDHRVASATGFPICRRFTNAHATGLISVTHSETVISIAGSNDVHDAVGNLIARSQVVRSSPSIQAHEGILNHAELVANGLRWSGHNFQPWQKRKLYITGHSLGGAVAVLLPLLMPELEPDLICTFGAPRVLDHDTAGLYPYPVRRFVGTADIVPLLPFSRRYSHVGDVRYVTTATNGKLIAERRWGALGKYWRLACCYGGSLLWGQLQERFRTSALLKAVRTYHSMSRYRSALEAAAKLSAAA